MSDPTDTTPSTDRQTPAAGAQARTPAFAEREVAELRAANAALQARLEATERRLQAVLDSAIWRGTQPVRALLDSARQLRRLPSLLRAAYRVGRTQGARGLVRAVRGVLANGLENLPAADRPPLDYAAWCREAEPDAEQLELQRQIAVRLPIRPMVSVLTPVRDEPLAVLRETLASVHRQTYGRWECYLADASTDASRQALLEEYTGGDGRFHFLRLDAGLGAAACLNAALHHARGDYVVSLGSGDRLAPDALFEAARALNVAAGADVVSWDEDRIAADGTTRGDPWFKPDHSPELLYSADLFGPCALKRSVLDSLGGFDTRAEGAHGWDLALRVAERTAAVVHLPRVLCHRRPPTPATAAVLEARANVLRAALTRRGFSHPMVRFGAADDPQVSWQVRGGKVSIVIPTKDRVGLLRRCLESLFAHTTYADYEIVLVDNNSREPETLRYYESLKGNARVRFVAYNSPFNYSAANNLGVRHADGIHYVFLNNDVEVLPEDGPWLEELVRWLELPAVGVVGCKLVYPSGAIQHAGTIMGLEGHGSNVFRGCPDAPRTSCFGPSESYRNFMAVTGACMALRKEVFDRLGGFDEAYQLCFSDLDLCLTALDHGYRVVYSPFARLVHHEGATRALHFPKGDLVRATARFLPIAAIGDPYYSMNLTQTSVLPAPRAADEPGPRQRLEGILAHFGAGGQWDATTEAGYAFENLLSDLLGRQLSSVPFPPASATPGPALLLVTHDLSRSGAPLMLYELARELTRRGHRVVVASAERGRLRETLEVEGIPVVVSPAFRDAPHVLGAFFRRFQAVLVNTVVCAHAVRAARAAGVPSVWFVHESGYGIASLQANELAAAAMRQADRVVFAARALADRYASYCRPETVRVVPYGISPPAEGAKGVPVDRGSGGPWHVLHVGSIEPRKGQDILVNAARRLPSEVASTTRIEFLGRTLDRPFHARVDALAQGLPHITFAGEVGRERVLRALASADVLVCSSRDEVTPVVIFEAMALAKAVVSTRVGGIAEIVEDGKTGLLVESGDDKGLAAALTRLHRDRPLAAALGRAGRERFQALYTVASYADRVQEMLREVAPGGASAASSNHLGGGVS